MTEYQLLLLLAGIFVFSFGVLWATEAFGFYRKYRGERLITCPETKKTEAVKIAVGKAAAKAVAGALGLRAILPFADRRSSGGLPRVAYRGRMV